MNSLSLNRLRDAANQPGEIPSQTSSPISSFYSGKSILVTGATGFIGKVLIEKLLYSCPQLDKIYLLIRPSKGKSTQERLIKMVDSKPLNIRLKRDHMLAKLVAVQSDLAEPKLGLTTDDFNLLAQRVSVIFHVAASVKFEAPLEVNMRHNVVATSVLLELASKFLRLQCFVHVSTAYSNCQLRHIDERIYHMEVPEDPMQLKVSKEMLAGRPNTYTYTKAMAENVASQYADRINIVVVRPSIVMSSMKEPDEGWVDTINGPVGLSVLGALGILQKIKVNSEVVFDLIPVDIVVNAILSIAWASTSNARRLVQNHLKNGELNNNTSGNATTALLAPTSSTVSKPAPMIPETNVNEGESSSLSKRIGFGRKTAEFVKSATGVGQTENKKTTKQVASTITPPAELPKLDGSVMVFNLTTGSENPCSFYQYFSIGREEAYKKPSARALRPLLKIPKQKGMNPTQYWIHKVFSHLLFAYLVDVLLILCGHKPMVVKSVKKMHHANEVFDYFCSNQWTFETENVQRLRDMQTATDKQVFNCDVRAIDWKIYAQIGWLGCRRFVLNEPDSTFDYAKRRYRAICFMYYIVKLILLLTISGLVKYYISPEPVMLASILIPVSSVVYLL